MLPSFTALNKFTCRGLLSTGSKRHWTFAGCCGCRFPPPSSHDDPFLLEGWSDILRNTQYKMCMTFPSRIPSRTEAILKEQPSSILGPWYFKILLGLYIICPSPLLYTILPAGRDSDCRVFSAVCSKVISSDWMTNKMLSFHRPSYGVTFRNMTSYPLIPSDAPWNVS